MTNETATYVRYRVVLLTTLMAVFLYLDRICLSFLERYIKEDLGLSNVQAGWLLSAFFWAYALGQVPAGWLSDRYGARSMLTLYILGWSLFTGLMGLASTFLVLLVFRARCGLAQAGAYPTGASVISKWVPFLSRGKASALVSTGGRIGGFLAPLLTAYLLLAFVPLEVSSRFTPAHVLDPKQAAEQLEMADYFGGPLKPLWDRFPDTLKEWRTLPVDIADMTAWLNSLLADRDLPLDLELDGLPLQTEAHRLLKIPSPELSEQQLERRNRLLLEALLPDALLKVYVHGWRPVLWVYGLAGLLVAAWFWLQVRNRPQEYPRCNAAEIELIEANRPPGASSPHGQVGGLPLRYMVRSFSLWCSSLSQFGTNLGWVFLITWLPRYLSEYHPRVLVGERGVLASLPLLIGMVGMMSGGWLTDRLTRAIGQRWGRGLPMALTRFSAMAAYLVCLLLESPYAVTAAFCVVAFSTDLGTASVWAFKQDVGGKYVGSILGWGNMWGNLGASVSPLLLNAAVDLGGWELCFVTCAAAFLVAGIAAFGVDATKPIVPPDVEKSLGERGGVSPPVSHS